MNAIPNWWLKDFHQSAGWRAEDTLDAISQSVSVLSPVRLSATISWFRAIGKTGQQLCWLAKTKSAPEYYYDFLGYLSGEFLNPNTLNDLLPRRFPSLPPGKLATDVPLVFDPRDYSRWGILHLLRGLLLAYDDSWTTSSWYHRVNAALDGIGGRLARTIFMTFVETPPCPYDKCSSLARRGIPYYPESPMSVLSFYLDRLIDGAPFIVTTSRHSIATNLYWLHLDFDEKELTETGEEDSYAWHHGDLDEIDKHSLPEKIQHGSGPICIMSFDGPIKLASNKGTTEGIKYTSISVHMWGDAIGVNMYRARLPGPVALRGPAVVRVGKRMAEIPDGKTLVLTDPKNPGRRLLASLKLLDPSQYSFRSEITTAEQLETNAPVTEPKADINLFEGDLPANLTYEAGKWVPYMASGPVAPFEDGWAKTNWRAISMLKKGKK
ncbi:hypothetical protein CDD81_3828 [Ophiocordyceps australis]|uniref:Uncharacterized protein n=1 Tax=Ophiocordyceps australis TaxID=1399860 RepID=A0A2C5XUJ8_9HYPO|nr:hypothetical protein CDD81_3828 [Ophiocordyceps australis]